MTAHGSIYGQFRRALKAGQAWKAMDLATELPKVMLDDALALCFLLAEAEDARFEPAARR